MSWFAFWRRFRRREPIERALFAVKKIAPQSRCIVILIGPESVDARLAVRCMADLPDDLVHHFCSYIAANTPELATPGVH